MNLDVHSATKKMPMEVFRNRNPRMNSYVDCLKVANDCQQDSILTNEFLPDDGEEGIPDAVYEELELTRNDDLELSDENFECANEESVAVIRETNKLNNGEHQVNQKHQAAYYRRMNKKSKPHLRKFSAGDLVLVKRDFDNNPNTRREMFRPTSQDDVYIIREMITELVAKIKIQDENKRNGETKTIDTSRLRRLNREPYFGFITNGRGQYDMVKQCV